MKTLLSMPWMCVVALLTLISCSAIFYWVILEIECQQFCKKSGVLYKTVAMTVVLCAITIVVVIIKSV
jgi:uncharacterized membrane protein YwzB